MYSVIIALMVTLALAQAGPAIHSQTYVTGARVLVPKIEEPLPKPVQVVDWSIHRTPQAPVPKMEEPLPKPVEVVDWSIHRNTQAPAPKMEEQPPKPVEVVDWSIHRNTQAPVPKMEEPPPKPVEVVDWSIHRITQAPVPNMEEPLQKPVEVVDWSIHRTTQAPVLKIEGPLPKPVEVVDWSIHRREPKCGCGISSAPRPSFIVNGDASGIDEWPWQAMIARSRRQMQIFTPICGGSLLNEDWVLTAAHCVTFAGRKDVRPISVFRIYLGKYYRDDEKDDKYVQVAEVGEIHVHTDYEPKTYDADIAMIKLKKPIKFTKRVRPVCLPTFQSTSENLVENKFGVGTGWGRAEDLQFTSTPKQARLPVVSSSVCAEGYKSVGYPITITDNMFCADYKEGRKDACSGNSGSPMVFQQSSTKKWTIEGILSWGSPNGCGNKNQYRGFVRIQRFLDWINEFL